MSATVRIKTWFDDLAPRELVWVAVDDRTWEPGAPAGRGPTEQAAIDDLMEQIDEEEDE